MESHDVQRETLEDTSFENAMSLDNVQKNIIKGPVENISTIKQKLNKIKTYFVGLKFCLRILTSKHDDCQDRHYFG